MQIIANKQQKLQIEYELFLLENNKKNSILYDKEYLSNLKFSISDISFSYSASTRSKIITKLNSLYIERDSNLENSAIFTKITDKIAPLERELANRDKTYKVRFDTLNEMKKTTTYKGMTVYTDILNRFKENKMNCSYNDFISEKSKCD